MAIPRIVPKQKMRMNPPALVELLLPGANATIPVAPPIAAAATRTRPQTIAARRSLPQPHQRSTASLPQTVAGRLLDEDTAASDRESETWSLPLCSPWLRSQQIAFCFPHNAFQPSHLSRKHPPPHPSHQ